MAHAGSGPCRAVAARPIALLALSMLAPACAAPVGGAGGAATPRAASGGPPATWEAPSGAAADVSSAGLPGRGADPGRGRGASPPAVVSEERFHAGPDGNLALRLTARFASRGTLLEALDLGAPVATWQGRAWTLADVLIDLNLAAGGESAAWRVSGPRPVVSAYGDALAARAERRDGLVELAREPIEVTVPISRDGLR